MTKAVIFDFDDTLVKTLETKIQALQEVAKTIYDFDLTTERIKEHWGKPYRELMRLLFLEAQDDLDKIIANYETIREQHPSTLYNDVQETLEKLFNKVQVGILTAANKNLVINDFILLNIPVEKFFYIQTAEDTSVHKPNPQVFMPILKKLTVQGITKKEIIYIGDSLNDYFAAKGAGIKFYAVYDRTTPKAEFEKHNVPLLHSINDLLDII